MNQRERDEREEMKEKNIELLVYLAWIIIINKVYRNKYYKYSHTYKTGTSLNSSSSMHIKSR